MSSRESGVGQRRCMIELVHSHRTDKRHLFPKLPMILRYLDIRKSKTAFTSQNTASSKRDSTGNTSKCQMGNINKVKLLPRRWDGKEEKEQRGPAGHFFSVYWKDCEIAHNLTWTWFWTDINPLFGTNIIVVGGKPFLLLLGGCRKNNPGRRSNFLLDPK